MSNTKNSFTKQKIKEQVRKANAVTGKEDTTIISIVNSLVAGYGVGSDTEPVLQEKTATENGTVTADAGYDGLSKVDVDVPIPDGYIKPSGTYNATENNKTYNITSYAAVSVNVPTSEAPEVTAEEVTITPTKETQEITPENADYISKAIIEPIPDEYVIPEGELTLTENGTYPVTEYASAVVAVPETPEWDSTNFTREGEPIETVTVPYMLSGKWLLNDTVTNPSTLDIEQDINFSSNGVDFTIINVYVNTDETETYIDYGKDNSDWELVYDTSAANPWGNKDAHKKVDFGITPQEVSKEFYAWFMENAVPNEIEHLAGFVYGSNVLAPTLDFSTIPSGWYDYTHYVFCQINSVPYIGFTIGNGTVKAITQATLETVTLYESNAWKNDTYKTWNFPEATSLTAVSTIFYEWVNANRSSVAS